MLNFEQKRQIFISFLEQNEISYADSFNGLISIYAENHEYIFLKHLQHEKDIELWITKLKSRIVMKEDMATLEDIIDEYIYCN